MPVLYINLFTDSLTGHANATIQDDDGNMTTIGFQPSGWKAGTRDAYNGEPGDIDKGSAEKGSAEKKEKGSESFLDFLPRLPLGQG